MPLARSVLLNDVNINPRRKLPSVERVLRAGPGALAVSRSAGEHNVPDAAASAAEAFTAVLMKGW